MNIILNIAIGAVAGGGIAFGLFKWLGEKWVSNWFSKDLKKYEHQLDLLKMQKQLQYSNVYVKRADILANIYGMLVEVLLISNQNLIRQPNETEKQIRAQRIVDKLGRMVIYSFSNGIYLTDSINANLVKIVDVIGKGPFLDHKDTWEDFTPEYIEKINSIKEENITPIIEELKSEFQELLGIKSKEH